MNVPEAATRRGYKKGSIKKVFSKISQYSQESNCAIVSCIFSVISNKNSFFGAGKKYNFVEHEKIGATGIAFQKYKSMLVSSAVFSLFFWWFTTLSNISNVH